MLKAGFVWLLESKTIFKFYLIYLTDTLTISATGEVIPSCLQAIQSPRYLTRGTIYEGKWTKQAKVLDQYQFFVSDRAENFTRFAKAILPNEVKDTKQINIEEY